MKNAEKGGNVMKQEKKLVFCALIMLCMCGLGTCITVNDYGDLGQTPSRYVNTRNIEWVDDYSLVRFSQPADTIDYIDAWFVPKDQIVLLTSLKAIVNAEQPRIFVEESRLRYIPGSGEGEYYQPNDSGQWPNGLIPENWLDRLGINYTVYSDPYELVIKYRSTFSKVAIYDPQLIDTINIASTYAGIYGTLVASPLVYQQLLERGINLEIAVDYQGMFRNKVEMYRYMYRNLWEHCNHKMFVSLDPENQFGFTRSFFFRAMTIVSPLVFLPFFGHLQNF